MSNEAGKGSRYRSVNRSKYDQNYCRIFNPECPICGESLDRWQGKYVCKNVKCQGYNNILKGIK